ncbi:MAG: endonuclease/exonuclease/phosphatase family protein [Gammaproteobacteria bacterium]|nr:endonuclease/exonuclease/phosphatase family protein [Gammaproteobacteria bacterium]
MSDDGIRRTRVASYNVHGCIGTDGVFAPQRIADVLAVLDADFIALQEVEDCEYKGLTVSQFLVDAVGLHAAARTTHKRAGLDYGNLLLSRKQPLQTTSHDLAFLQREPRGAIEAHFDLHSRSLRIIATHFGLSMKERRAQLQKLLPRLENREADLTVLCADFNEWIPYSRVHRVLRQVMGNAPALRTFPSRMPALSLDRIYASPLAPLVNIKAIATGDARVASDHLPIVADFDLAKI